MHILKLYIKTIIVKLRQHISIELKYHKTTVGLVRTKENSRDASLYIICLHISTCEQVYVSN